VKLIHASALVLAAAGLTACSKTAPSDPLPVAPAARVIGEPVSCLQLTQFRNTKIRDDRTIDFMGSSKKVWRNTLSNSCPGLRAEDAFTYETSLSQLCNVDIIYVLRRVGGGLQRGAGCGLGQFVPVELEKK